MAQTSPITIAPETSLYEALRQIDKAGGVTTLFVVDTKRVLLGVLGTLDIRRALINGIDLGTPISKIMRKDPLVLPEKFSDTDVVNLFLSESFRSRKPTDIPVINSKKQVVRFFATSDLFQMSLFENGELTRDDIVHKKHILVLGGAGYIGSVLIRLLLERGYRVTILDTFLYGDHSIENIRANPNLSIIRGDTRHIDILVPAIQSAAAVVHLAELVGDPLCADNPNTTFEINYIAASTIARICADLRVHRYIYISSCSVYGASGAPEDYLTEQSALNPVSLYARMKINSERALLGVNNDHFCPCILRLGTVFGFSPRQRFDLVVNALTAKAIEYGKIEIFGGDQWRPHVSTNDTSEAILSVLEAPSDTVRNQIFNIVSENMRIRDLGELIAKVIPGTKVLYRAEGKDQRNYKISGEKISKALAFKPKRSVREGVVELQAAFEKGLFPDIEAKQYYNVKVSMR